MPASIERGAGPPVLLLHGQPGTGSSFGPLVALLERDFSVLAPDRAGYGSSTSEALGLAANAELAAELLAERHADPAIVVAHSWSGGAAVLLAARHPDLVDGLVLVGSACTPDSINALDRLLVLPVVGDVLTVMGLAGLGSVLPPLRSMLLPLLPGSARDRVAAALPDGTAMGGARGAFGRHKRSFMIEQRALVDELPAVTGALGSLDLPVAVVCGEWDLVVPVGAAVALARAVRGSELIVVPRSGHFVARDDPEALADVVRRVRRRAVERRGGRAVS